MTVALEPTLSPRDVAELTGLSYQSVLAEIRAGRLRAKRVRGHYLVLPEQYLAWLQPDELRVPERAPAVAPARSTRARSAGSVAALRAIEGGAR